MKCIFIVLLTLYPFALFAQPTWEHFSELNVPRSFHNALYIGNNEVLVMGGYEYSGSDPVATASCELIDVSTKGVLQADSMNNPRTEFVALLTSDSNVIVVSGLAGKQNRGILTPTVERYDRITKTWQVLGSLNIARRQHVATFINNHEILVVGGRLQNHTTIADAEIFDITTGLSRSAAPFPFVINSASIAHTSNGDIVVLAGREGGANSNRSDIVYRYNRAANSWEETSRIAMPLQGTHLLKLWNGKLLISGGARKENPLNFARQVQVEDAENWRVIGSMQSERQWSSAAQWTEDTVITIGGYNNNTVILPTTDWVDVETQVQSLATGPELIEPRAFFPTVTIPDCWSRVGFSNEVAILAIGGLKIFSEPTANIEILSRKQNRSLPRRDTSTCKGEDRGVRLSTVTGDSYFWYPSQGLSCNNCRSPLANPDQTTTYTVEVISSCGILYDTVDVIVHPPPLVEISADTTICSGQSVQLFANGGDSYRWEPKTGLSCDDCPAPEAFPEETTTYVVQAWNAEGCRGVDSVTVVVREEPETIRLQISRGLSGYSGERLVIPVEVISEIASSDITEFEFELVYDPKIMVLDESSIDRLLSQTLLEGWRVEILRHDHERGSLLAKFYAPPGETLSGIGELLRFEASLYLSDVLGTELQFEVHLQSQCFNFEEEPGYARLDSVCGFNFRFIEINVEKYIPPTVYPNPSSELIMFEFSLGLDGMTQLEVFDVGGRRVALIVDDPLEAGRYSVEWDVQDIPSGLYWYRMKSGDWVQSGQVYVAQ